MKKTQNTSSSHRMILYIKLTVIALIIAMHLSFTSCSPANAQKEENLFSVSGQMLYHPPQCSGTLREDFLISTKLSPLTNTVFYIKKGNVNSIGDTSAIKIITDEQGRFGVSLPKGEYVLLHQFQKDTMSIHAFRGETENYIIDNEEEMWQSFLRPVSVLKVADKNLDSLSFVINVTCFTPSGLNGINYIGPMPE